MLRTGLVFTAHRHHNIARRIQFHHCFVEQQFGGFCCNRPLDHRDLLRHNRKHL